jgi:hypothetical protein
MTTLRTIFFQAHEIARREIRTHGAFYNHSYRAAFADALRAIHAERKYDAEMDAKYGVDMRPAFQIIEPARAWA